jgi:hypothetical protein
MPKGNRVVAPGVTLVNHTTASDFYWYEQLPERWRLVLQDYTDNFTALDLYNALLQYGPDHTYNALRETERKAVDRIAQKYLRDTGSPYPHTAARATIQRYGPVIPKRRPSYKLNARARKQLRRAGFKEVTEEK